MGTDSKILTVFRVGPSRGFQLSRDIDEMLVKRAGLQTLGNAHQQTQQAKGERFHNGTLTTHWFWASFP